MKTCFFPHGTFSQILPHIILERCKTPHPARVSPAHSTSPTVLCSRSNDQLHTILYYAILLSWHIDVIDGHGSRKTRMPYTRLKKIKIKKNKKKKKIYIYINKPTQDNVDLTRILLHSQLYNPPGGWV